MGNNAASPLDGHRIAGSPALALQVPGLWRPLMGGGRRGAQPLMSTLPFTQNLSCSKMLLSQRYRALAISRLLPMYSASVFF
ncbi:hypothetical protein DQX05_16840 [Paenibacillus thiaminolyticus]|uniref:Uncharacterized protein n=1 Tax=Paenibacillus thiaminolyticus TaxID=49283 RepID=A0A3A3GJJ6_PANTH|nr:hypothetical protein DQX05_16840 [Paenibacillus thiaminolyticus]